MDGQERICAKCGQEYGEGHNFCFNCGAELREQKEAESEQIEQIEQIEVEEIIQEVPKKIKRNKYKARRFMSLFFAIFDIFLAAPLWVCGVIFEKVSHLLYYDKSQYAVGSDEYILSEVSDTYYFLAGVCYALAILFAVGCVISAIMFFVYVRKRRKFKLSLEAQEMQEPIFEEQEEIEEGLEQIEEAEEKEPKTEIQGSQNQEQV